MSSNAWSIALALTACAATACGGDEGHEPPEPAPAPTAEPSEPDPAPPPPLDVTRSEAFRLPGIGDLSDLALRERDGERVVLVTGTCGLAVVSVATRAVLETGRYALPCPPMYRGRIVDVDGDGAAEILRLGAGLMGPCAVLELDGTVRWRVDEPARGETPLDLDHDGRVELFVGRAGQPAARLLDHSGAELWSTTVPALTRDVGQCDVTGDGIDELLFVTGAAVEIRDPADGSLVHEAAPPEPAYVDWLRVLDGGGRARFAIGMSMREGERGHRVYELAADGMTWIGWRDVPSNQAPPAPLLALPGGLTVAAREARERALGTGFTSSELHVTVTDELGRERFADVVPGADGRAIGGGHPALLLSADPPRFWVAYGETVYEYALE